MAFLSIASTCCGGIQDDISCPYPKPFQSLSFCLHSLCFSFLYNSAIMAMWFSLGSQVPPLVPLSSLLVLTSPSLLARFIWTLPDASGCAVPQIYNKPPQPYLAAVYRSKYKVTSPPSWLRWPCGINQLKQQFQNFSVLPSPWLILTLRKQQQVSKTFWIKKFLGL